MLKACTRASELSIESLSIVLFSMLSRGGLKVVELADGDTNGELHSATEATIVN
ncbi:hypothetical protein [Mesorhizobium sp. NZP2077]|uniref:hypothetical protein n=1 Tax=Mesorhizobium sp. NZP2077 TaxID=2483404 RepID=UPI001FEF3B2C|nr:hypothetical protein [Mesorhizobium sp. NZP2077]